MNDATPIRAAIYARVSTDEQAENGTSLDTQRERCRAFIAAKGWVVGGEYVDDGVSGTKASRPELDRMMSDCRSGRLDAVVFAKFDRFSRNRRHLENATAELDDLGVAIVSVSENIDGSTATGQAFRALLGVFANLERDMIVERTTLGLRSIAGGGYWPGGPPPYGFRIVAVDGTTHKRLEEDPMEAETIRTAVALLVDEGLTTRQAAHRLNALGYVPRRAKKWAHHHVRRTLLEAPLAGEWVYARNRGTKRAKGGQPVTVQIPAILSPERHQALLIALASTSTVRAHSSYYLLSGRLFGRCGARFHGVNRHDRGLRQYRCNDSRCEVENRCDCRRLNADDVEFVVWEAVTDLLSAPDRLLALAHDYLGMRKDQVKVERSQIEDVDRRITKLERTLAERVTEYLKAGVDAGAVRAATSELDGELTALRRHRETLHRWTAENTQASQRMQRLWELADRAHTRLSTMEPHERRIVLDLLDVRVTVTGWTTCTHCAGRGKVRGGSGGIPCAVCRATRAVPSLRIEGTVWDALLDALDGDGIVGDQTDVGPRHSTCCRR